MDTITLGSIDYFLRWGVCNEPWHDVRYEPDYLLGTYLAAAAVSPTARRDEWSAGMHASLMSDEMEESLGRFFTNLGNLIKRAQEGA